LGSFGNYLPPAPPIGLEEVAAGRVLVEILDHFAEVRRAYLDLEFLALEYFAVEDILGLAELDMSLEEAVVEEFATDQTHPAWVYHFFHYFLINFQT